MRAFAHPALTNSELARTLLQHAVLHGERVAESRDRLADGLVGRRDRLARNALVPDLADAGAFPADQMKRGFGGAGHGKGGESDTGGGTEGGQSKHGKISPVGEWLAGLRKCDHGGGARSVMHRASSECGENVIGFNSWPTKKTGEAWLTGPDCMVKAKDQNAQVPLRSRLARLPFARPAHGLQSAMRDSLS